MEKLLQIVLCTLPFSIPESIDPIAPTQQELAFARQWGEKNFLSKELRFPFSFKLDGNSSAKLLPKWEYTITRTENDSSCKELTLHWHEPLSQLTVRCALITYTDFPVVEWTLFIKNEGNIPSPRLNDLFPLDINIPCQPNESVFIHTTKGDWCSASSFQPLVYELCPKNSLHFAPYGGRPTNAAFPYYNIQFSKGGVILAIGWPGQWAASFIRNNEHNLSIHAGQEVLDVVLQPGEQVRSPLIVLLFWEGQDITRAQNLWRRWMITHNLPRTANGQLPPTQIVACSSHQFKEMTQANEANQKLFINRYLEENLNIDYWWMDAGWYPCNGEWPNTGTWQPDPERFPNGLRSVSNYAHNHGVKTIVWFEPERVGDPNSWLAQHHPEWLLTQKSDQPPHPNDGIFGSGPGGLLNLGNPEARDWLINHISKLIENEGIDLYRQDFNIAPLPFWRAADTPDRKGMTENLYVQGYLTFWDTLRQHHPMLRIDSCASGGRRNDLETLRRAVPLLRSDYLFEPSGQQCHHYALASWIPYHGTGYLAGPSVLGAIGTPKIDTYAFRSTMSPSLTLCFDVRQQDLDYDLARKLFNQLKTIQPFYLADFYPLTPYSLADDVWIAWQYHNPHSHSGIIQAFRRPKNNENIKHFPLQGLQADANYECVNFDHDRQIYFGKTLLEQGIPILLEKPASAAIITYKKLP